MIDLIIAFFFFLDTLGFLMLEQIITVNFFLVVLSRGYYILVYFLYYYNDIASHKTDSAVFTKKHLAFYGLKQISIVLFGILYLPVAVFVCFYSLLLSSGYLKQIAEKTGFIYLKHTGTLFLILFPLLGLLVFTLLSEIYALIAVGLSLLLYLQYGMKIVSKPYLKVIEKWTSSVFNRVKYGDSIKAVVLIVLIVIPSTLLIGTAVYAPPEKITTNITMRDGTQLATDIYYAPGSFGGPRPVILVRTTYGKDGSGIYKTFYQPQGYHVVVQDCRGCYDSGDKDNFMLFQSAYIDGVDTIEWILDQPFCNGKIASVGASALAINEYYYAGMGPEGLVAQSLMIGTPDLYDVSMYRGGAFLEDMVVNWVKGTAPNNWEYQLNQIIQHSKKDEFHNSTCLSMNIGPTFDKINVAGIHIGGWYDPFCQGTINGYIGYDDKGTENARGKQLLIMTPSTHGFPGEGEQGELEFPTKSTSGFDLYMSWEQKLLDYALLGKNYDWTGNRVAYYVMGDVDDETVKANDYRFANDWPVPHSNDTWYLTSENGMLQNVQGITSSKFEYLYDPRNPVPTVGGNNLLIAAGPYDQREVEERDDVVVFETDVFTEPYEIIGRMWAHLTVSSNCTNTDFTVKICDVYPDGRSMLISDGIINAKRRDGFNKDAPALNQAGIVELDVDLWSTAYQINTGHRLRISISSSNYPRFAINPNTGADQQVYSYQYLERIIAKNSIYVGPSYNSYLILPTPI